MTNAKKRDKQMLALWGLAILMGVLGIFNGIDRIITDTGFFTRSVGYIASGLFLVGLGGLCFIKELKGGRRGS